MKKILGYSLIKKDKIMPLKKQKIKLLSVFLGIVSVFLSATVFADLPPVEGTLLLDKPQVANREDFRLTLQIKSVDEGIEVASKGITIPGIEHFAQIGTSNATNIKMANGQSLVSSEITKVLVPKETGTFTLGPIEIPIKNKQGLAESIQTNTVTITVTEAQENTKSTPPSILGDNTGFFEPEEMGSVSIIPETNRWFWVQIALIVSALWGVWFFLNKKIEQKKKKQETPVVLEDKTFRQKEEMFVLPDSQDPEFLEKIHTILVKFCQKKLDLDASKITKSVVIPKAEKKLHPESMRILNEVLMTYEKARFGKMPIDRMQFKQRLQELLKEKTS